MCCAAFGAVWGCGEGLTRRKGGEDISTGAPCQGCTQPIAAVPRPQRAVSTRFGAHRGPGDRSGAARSGLNSSRPSGPRSEEGGQEGLCRWARARERPASGVWVAFWPKWPGRWVTRALHQATGPAGLAAGLGCNIIVKRDRAELSLRAPQPRSRQPLLVMGLFGGCWEGRLA
jgi:hypothetical protein